MSDDGDPEGIGAMYAMKPKVDPSFGDVLPRLGQKWPAVQPYLNTFAVQQGPEQSDGRQLEFYPPWESDNPNPGRTTLEIYNRGLQGPALDSAVAGDSLHLLGSVDPRSGQPVDDRYHAMKQQLIHSLTPGQLAVDQQAYDREQDPRPFDEWMQDSRGDAYIRGRLTPDAANNWRDVYTDPQKVLLNQMRDYLENPRGERGRGPASVPVGPMRAPAPGPMDIRDMYKR